jgi:hypothetical protein
VTLSGVKIKLLSFLDGADDGDDDEEKGQEQEGESGDAEGGILNINFEGVSKLEDCTNDSLNFSEKTHLSSSSSHSYSSPYSSPPTSSHTTLEDGIEKDIEEDPPSPPSFLLGMTCALLLGYCNDVLRRLLR